MNYRQANDYLDNFSNYEKKAHLLKPRFSLTEIRKLLAKLGNPEKNYPSIHVAGTVGKGSVCHMVESVLREAGCRTALYSSPHLVDIRERITAGGRMITKKDFLHSVEKIRDVVGDVFDELTYFEVLTALAFDYFADRRVDIAIVEVGLGGRLDATNMVPPFVSAITTLGWDHVAVLGPSLSDIAAEKAGIIKRGAAVVVSPQHWRAMRVIEETCRSKKAKLAAASPRSTVRHAGADQGREIFEIMRGAAAGRNVRLPLLGDFQAINLSTALEVISVAADRGGFPVCADNIIRGLESVSFPGRMEYVKLDGAACDAIIDGAHNAPAADALADSLAARYGDNPHVIFLIGMLQDKDADTVMKRLARAGRSVVVTELPFDRSTPAGALECVAKKYFDNVYVTENMHDAIKKAVSLSKNKDAICITGSLYAVAEAKRTIGKI